LAGTQNCRFSNIVSHSGGLPGYGSQMRWLPEYGVGIVALANGTYAGPGRAVNEALEALAGTGALNPRQPQPGADVLRVKSVIDGLLNRWSDADLQGVAAMNLFLDRSLERRRREFDSVREKVGICHAEAPIVAENAMRGTWLLACDRGQVKLNVTLAPTLPPTVQHLEATAIVAPSPGLAAAIETLVKVINQNERIPENRLSLSAPSDLSAQVDASRVYGQCSSTGLTAGGPDAGVAQLKCERGNLDVRLAVDSAGLITALRIGPAAGEVCVP
jgi:hypothetical protein